MLYVTNAWGIDETIGDGGQISSHLFAYEHPGFGCKQTYTRSAYDVSRCSFGTYSVSSQQAWSDTTAGCTGYGDPTDCHMPDVLFTPPSPGDYSYETILWVFVCDADGSNCTYNTESGCFDFTWAQP